MCDCLLLVLTREEDGRWSWVPVRQEEEDPKADLRSLEGGALFQWHLPTLFRRTPAAHVTVSVFCQLAGKALECVSPLWDQPALAWALARGPALRPGCPQGVERRPSGPRRRVGWQSSRAWPPSLCVFPPAPPIPHPPPRFQSKVSYILIFVYLQSVICGIYSVVNSPPSDRVPFFWAAFLGVI